jgi:threonylcarbamoyladenosine tRNA methylthiotransferase MtaB
MRPKRLPRAAKILRKKVALPTSTRRIEYRLKPATTARLPLELTYNTLVKQFHVENFGCRATQADGAAIERQLLDRGMVRSDTSNSADVVVLNTCTVTASADHDARATIRRIHRENPNAQIVVTGCYAQRAPEEIASIPGVSVVIGNSHKHALAELALARQNTPTLVPLSAISAAPNTGGNSDIVVGDIFAHTELLAAPVFDSDNEKTRPNLKVQDGCNNRCSFCIIPFVRGRSRSLPLGNIIANVNQLVANGYREIVLSGINLGRWGRDLGEVTHSGFSEVDDRPSRRVRFVDLLRAILADTQVERLRISSVEPMDWSDELIEFVASTPRIASHAHVPLQSGSDRILRLMHRRYRPWHYEDRIRRIHAAMPEAAIGADVMVGFPGETDEDFEQTYALIDRLPFTYLHVFTYSSRPGTPSAQMPNQVHGNVKRERNRRLRELAASKRCAYQEKFIGRRLAALTLTHVSEGRTECLTANYQKLWLEGVHEANLSLEPLVTGIEGEALVGRI